MKKGFSLVELLISLIVISCITAAFTPIITKKFSSGVFGGGSYDLTVDCADKFGDFCTLCTSAGCIDCGIPCPDGEYMDTKNCICLPCKDKYGEDCTKCNEKKCLTCPDGEYLDSDDNCQSCSVKFSNCATCTESECTSCADGYVLTNPTSNTPCTSFSCSSPDFIQIGNLCITKKNMGDGDSLTIPSGVNVVSTGTTCSPSASNFCCWQGKTASPCDNENGGAYNGCRRTVCDWYAADYICSNFNAAGKTWRLATSSEMTNWGANSIGLGVNGLQLCDRWSGYSSAYCIISYSCPGSSLDWCCPRNVWSGTVDGSSYAYYYDLDSGSWFQGSYYRTYAFSVRCVTEMPQTCTDKAGANCLMCNGNTCLGCKDGYVLKNGKCEIDCASKYGSACTSCTASACTACKSGYALKNGVCNSCSSLFANCSTCSATSCSSCNSGYILNNGICSNCSKYGAGCTSCNSSTCLSCLSGYKLNGTICTYDCSVYDAKCVNCDNVRCNLCAAGYQLSGGKCVNTCSKFGEGCVSCSSTRCNKCALGYVLEFGACITSCQSEFGNGCVRCSSNVWGDRECLECDGYYDEAGWCQPYNQTVPPDLQNPWW